MPSYLSAGCAIYFKGKNGLQHFPFLFIIDFPNYLVWVASLYRFSLLYSGCFLRIHISEIMNDSTFPRLYIGRRNQHRPLVKQSFRLLALMKHWTLLSELAYLFSRTNGQSIICYVSKGKFFVPCCVQGLKNGIYSGHSASLCQART